MQHQSARFSFRPRIAANLATGCSHAPWQKLLIFSSVALAVFLVSAISPAAASAAETVVLRYGIFRGSLPMADLTEFAATGTESARLKRYLRLGKQEPAELQKILNDKIATEPRSLNLVLASPAGDALLGELSRYIYSSERDDKAKLRSSIESSTADDQQLSLLELLQNYPTEEVYINVRRAITTYQQIASIQTQVENVDGVVEGVFGGGLNQILREIDRR